MLDLEEWPVLRHLRPQTEDRRKTQRPKSSYTSKSTQKCRNTRTNSTEEDQLQPGLQNSDRRKRCRAVDDIEGEDTLCLQRKKRKLRHSLSTSRLSKPYAVPTTYIASRKSLREGIWARQRVAGRNLLRKAAAMNSFAKKRKAYQHATRRSRAQSKSASVSPHLKPSRSRSPSSPRRSRSPHSSTSSTFSDYHIFDFEDDVGFEDDGEWLGSSVINSDFGKLQEVEWDVAQEYGFDDSSNLELDDIYNFDPGGKGKAMGLILENERQSEVSLAPRII